MNALKEFYNDVENSIKKMGSEQELKKVVNQFMELTGSHKYSYNFSHLGRPIIQYPQDIVAVQEMIWEVRPDLIIETGIAHGGSLILSASMLAMLDMCEAIDTGMVIDPAKSKRKVIGIDIDIRDHNRVKIEAHPMYSRIEMLEGSSTEKGVVTRVQKIASEFNTVMVFLDSNHTHEHVLNELQIYAPLVSLGSYCVVFDTILEDLPDILPGRPWNKENNPKTAVRQYLKNHPEFEVDHRLQNKLLVTVAPEGYLKRVR